MLLNFECALSRSSLQFKEVLQPELTRVLKGSFEIVEGIMVERAAKLLDTMAGIDIWHVYKGIRGIALRIQTTDINYHTFTIRKERQSGAMTEYEKRKLAIKNNFLFPYLTIQAYINQKNELIAYAIVGTKNLIEMIDRGFFKIRETGKNQIGQASFYVVDWFEMKKHYYVWIGPKHVITPSNYIHERHVTQC